MERFHIGMIGIFAGICTTTSFVPQIVKIVKTKHVRDISLRMYVILSSGIFLWLVYGFLLGEMPIILANTVAFIMCLFIVAMKIKYGDKKGK